MTGPFEGEAVLIPRIPMIPADPPFQFKRLQFLIRLEFAITINKAQGQSLEKCGIDLYTDCFSHGQLYTACSRVGKPDNLYICSDNLNSEECCIFASFTQLICIVSFYLCIYIKTNCVYACLFVW